LQRVLRPRHTSRLDGPSRRATFFTTRPDGHLPDGRQDGSSDTCAVWTARREGPSRRRVCRCSRLDGRLDGPSRRFLCRGLKLVMLLISSVLCCHFSSSCCCSDCTVHCVCKQLNIVINDYHALADFTRSNGQTENLSNIDIRKLFNSLT